LQKFSSCFGQSEFLRIQLRIGFGQKFHDNRHVVLPSTGKLSRRTAANCRLVDAGLAGDAGIRRTSRRFGSFAAGGAAGTGAPSD
jgi:hypothetical protein